MSQSRQMPHTVYLPYLPYLPYPAAEGEALSHGDIRPRARSDARWLGLA